MGNFYKKSQIVSGGEQQEKSRQFARGAWQEKSQFAGGGEQKEKSRQSARVAWQEKSQSGRGRVQQKKAQSGRSMVEMLGVLAIIGVLSIAGISAYSQAMFKYQLTTQEEAFNMLLHRAVELQPILQREYGKISIGSQNVGKIMAETDTLPNGIYYNPQNKQIHDVFKNTIAINYQHSSRGDGSSATDYLFWITLNRDGNKITERDRAICRNILLAAQQNADNIAQVGVRSSADSGSGYSVSNLRGKGLRNAGIAEIDNVCNSCNSQQSCAIALYISSVTN